MTDEIREGFKPIFRTSPFIQLLGPVYYKKKQNIMTVALQVQQKHCNARQQAHGGVLSSLADIALGYGAAFSKHDPIPLVTASLTIDYMSSVNLGDWLEIETDVQKIGSKMAFANCKFTVESKQVARASGVFSVVNRC